MGMRMNRIVKVLALFVVLIPFLVLSFRVGSQLYQNRQLLDKFAYNDAMDQYQRMVPVDQMDLSEFDHYLEFNITLEGRPPIDNTLVLPNDLQYFTEQNGQKVPVHKIEKGTRILWLPTVDIKMVSLGYGLHGYPTYEKGWRYARPFVVSGEQTDISKLPYYYVKMADLERLAIQATRATSQFSDVMKKHKFSLEEHSFQYTRIIDRIFYENGVFCSPDWQRPVWHWVDSVLLALTIALAFSVWLLKRILYHHTTPCSSGVSSPL